MTPEQSWRARWKAAAKNYRLQLKNPIQVRLRNALAKQNHEISQILARALGYPKFSHDQKNFPGATEQDGCAVGDHVAETLAVEAAQEIERLKADSAALRQWIENEALRIHATALNCARRSGHAENLTDCQYWRCRNVRGFLKLLNPGAPLLAELAELTTLRTLATLAAGFCAENAGMEITENGRRLREVVGEWSRATAGDELEPGEYQRTADPDC